MKELFYNKKQMKVKNPENEDIEICYYQMFSHNSTSHFAK